MVVESEQLNCLSLLKMSELMEPHDWEVKHLEETQTDLTRIIIMSWMTENLHKQ